MRIFRLLFLLPALLYAQSRGINNYNYIDHVPAKYDAGFNSRSYDSNTQLNILLNNRADTPTGFFPENRIFPKFFADGTAEQFSLSKDAFTRQWIGGIGGILRVYQFMYGTAVIQIGIGSTVYASLFKEPDVVNVQTVNFFVDVPIEIRFNKMFAVRTGYGHYSAHLADDGIEALKLHSINYAKDYLPLFLAYNLDSLGSCIYGGVRFDAYTIPEYNKRWNIQLGIEGGNYEIFSGVKLYGAVDIKFKSEVAWATTQSYQIGIKILEKGSHDVRIAYTYRTGIDDRGQFYKNKLNLSLIGVYFDF